MGSFFISKKTFAKVIVPILKAHPFLCEYLVLFKRQHCSFVIKHFSPSLKAKTIDACTKYF